MVSTLVVSCTVTKGGVAAFPSICNQITVNPITSPGDGIQFASAFLAANGSFDDAVVNYHVSSQAGITSVGLDFKGFFMGIGITSVTESIFNGNQLVGFAKSPAVAKPSVVVAIVVTASP